jgi:hypothetical protein
VIAGFFMIEAVFCARSIRGAVIPVHGVAHGTERDACRKVLQYHRVPKFSIMVLEQVNSLLFQGKPGRFGSWYRI